MKKTLIFFIFMVSMLTVAIGISAANGDIIGKIYSTDILAYVNGKPIESYNIGGKTVIMAEKLFQSDFNFSGYYDESDRLLTVEPFFAMPYGEDELIERGTPGKMIGDVYETDIKVLFKGLETKGYNIGGETAICIEELGELLNSSNADYGFSNYYCNYQWDAGERTIKLNTYINNIQEIMGLNFTFVKYTFLDNVITPRYSLGDAFSTFEPIGERTYNYSEIFDKHKINPLFINVNGKLHEIGTGLAINDYTYFNIADIEKAKGLIRGIKEPPMSYDDAIDYLYNLQGYTVSEKLESKQYTLISLLSDATGGKRYAAVKKSGGFVFLQDYTNDPDRATSMEFEENTAIISEYPFADSHGRPATLRSHCNLDEILFE
ncbi:MAG: hypothetical protein M0R40_06180 [Firmicutes bacterium]|nr:hypothetical protein [Bacillota bacterium]